MRNISGKVAAVTGGGSGIGRALALRLARRGCHVALADIDETGLNETLDMLGAYPVDASATVLDVADEAAVFAWAEAVVADFGQVNLVFNNAGVALAGTVRDLSLDDYRWIVDINLWGVIYGTKAFLPYLEASGEGHIINISSVFGLTAQPLMSGYNATKFAVRGFTESLRQDLELTGSCVSCTCVHPGGIQTNIAKSSRMDQSTQSVTGSSSSSSRSDFERTFITSADSAARQIMRAVEMNKRRVLVGPDAKLYDLVARIAPTGYQKVFTSVIRLRRWRSNDSAPVQNATRPAVSV
ncbi:MAG: SDR family NAD(P)-dependent oxidoreductase [Actinobacteria bacterium]|nr:SDR family NAD(P)-dependent oxidoreductase [Actinomycetota bacterium]MCB9388841.1 SDR family NAD(P)-dependent oxidoreductase [Acidimicrobiia bacterium]